MSNSNKAGSNSFRHPGSTGNIFAHRIVRDILIQATLAIGLLAVISFFSYNYIQNTSAGERFSWLFWDNVSKVDQPEPRLLPVDSSNSVASAYAFGLVNTLTVAVAGIVTATFLGFLIGIIRLSPNFLLSRLAQSYIEFLRNIPLAVQFLFLYVILLTLPSLRDDPPLGLFDWIQIHNDSIDFPTLAFGNGDQTGLWLDLMPFKAEFFKTQIVCDAVTSACSTHWGLVALYGIIYLLIGFAIFFYIFPKLERYQDCRVNGIIVSRKPHSMASIARSALITAYAYLFLTVETTFPPLMGWSMFWVFCIALLWGFTLKRLINNWADDRLDATGHRPNITLISWIALLSVTVLPFLLLGGPVSIQEYVYNDKGRPEFGFSVPISMIALWGALSIYTSAFIAEIVRAGIQAVPKGQSEASMALGLRSSLISKLIIIPQSLRVIVPPLSSQYMNLAKNSTLAFILQYPDLQVVLNTTRNNTGRELEVAIIVLFSYLSISLLISIIMNYFNARVQLVER